MRWSEQSLCRSGNRTSCARIDYFCSGVHDGDDYLTPRPGCAEHQPSRELEICRVPSVSTRRSTVIWFLQCLREPGADRTFPYQIINANNNSAEACLSQCSKFGYPAAGMEYGDECCTSIRPCFLPLSDTSSCPQTAATHSAQAARLPQVAARCPVRAMPNRCAEARGA